jgi:endoglucanase
MSRHAEAKVQFIRYIYYLVQKFQRNTIYIWIFERSFNVLIMQRFIYFLLSCSVSFSLLAQPIIYKDAQTLITGSWAAADAGGTATLTEVTGQTPFEGNQHYRFDYNFSSYWAGIGLNMDNWGNNPPRNLSGYSHIRIAYRGLSAGQGITLTLRNGNDFGNSIQIGALSNGYAVVDISIFSLTNASAVTATAVRELDFSITSNTPAGNGTVYLDAIELVNISNNAAQTSTTTWSRANSLGTGVNTSNWLEAFWLLPYNAYPEFSRYTRTKVRDLRNAGFTTFRLPVIFERLGSTSSPYSLNTGHIVFDLVDSMILWASIYQFKLVICNHHGYELNNNNYTTELPRLNAVWTQLMERYGNLDPNQYFFEIYNEPTNIINNSNWRIMAESVVSTIRSVETVQSFPRHSLVVGATGWNSGPELTAFIPLNDPDIIYTFHNYDPYFFTHQGMSWTTPAYFPMRSFPQTNEVAEMNDLMTALDGWSANFNVPVSMGEFGCSTAADAISRCNWIETITTAIAPYGFSRFYWDAISPTDAFGFYAGGVISQSACIPCFKNALGLYAALPLSLTAQKLRCDQGKVRLYWTIEATEVDGTVTVESSADGIQWQPERSYNLTVGRTEQQFAAINGAAYYRLNMKDVAGKTQFGPVIRNDCMSNIQVKISPNPTSFMANISLLADSNALVAVELLDVAGRLIERYECPEQAQQFSIPLYQFPAGTYFLRGTLESGDIWVKQVQRY